MGGEGYIAPSVMGCYENNGKMSSRMPNMLILVIKEYVMPHVLDSYLDGQDKDDAIHQQHLDCLDDDHAFDYHLTAPVNLVDVGKEHLAICSGCGHTEFQMLIHGDDWLVIGY